MYFHRQCVTFHVKMKATEFPYAYCPTLCPVQSGIEVAKYYMYTYIYKYMIIVHCFFLRFLLSVIAVNGQIQCGSLHKHPECQLLL